MIVAVPTQDGAIEGHWGHCAEISLYREGSWDTPFKKLSTDQSCACKSGLAQVLAQEKVTHVIVGNIGEGAYAHLLNIGMKAYRGIGGNAAQAVKALVAGTLGDKKELCQHHGCEDHGGFDLKRPR